MSTQNLAFDWIAICGRTMAEYQQFFDVDFAEWSGMRVLDCPGGTSSFVAEACERNICAVAADIVYGQQIEDIVGQARRDIAHVVERVGAVPHLFTWVHCPTLEELRSRRESALEQFAGDYATNPGRYVRAELPRLPFCDGEFDYVLSGHLLFNYDDRFDYAFHLSSIVELVRVCRREVRLFPVRGRKSLPYEFMEKLRLELAAIGIRAEIRSIPYEFMRGWNEIMIIQVAA